MNMIGERASKNQMLRNHIAVTVVVAIFVSTFSLEAIAEEKATGAYAAFAFHDAKFRVGTERKAIRIRLKYL